MDGAILHGLHKTYDHVRTVSAALVAPLSEADAQVQSMPDASPAKWHLAHTTWFFETFILRPIAANYRPLDEAYHDLFNSYYNAVGAQYPRAKRGLITRPDVQSVLEYRQHVDAAIQKLLSGDPDENVLSLCALGLQHEQQHQELLLTDIKHAFAKNPQAPVYRAAVPRNGSGAALRWHGFDAGLYETGFAGDGFAFDNEAPRHKVYLDAFRLASRPVSNGEYQAFIADGGYTDPRLWLADGWAHVQVEQAQAPLYWRGGPDGWRQFTLGGVQDIDSHAPVTHLNFYEAQAFAAWAGKRLPTEAEWEVAAATRPITGNFQETGSLHPQAATGDGLIQMFGDVWEWTSSDYRPYPGYKPWAGAVGEYNGKFMCSQYVLRGGSCVTPQAHIRASYRNFFYPHQAWQFTGLRLAEDG